VAAFLGVFPWQVHILTLNSTTLNYIVIQNQECLFLWSSYMVDVMSDSCLRPFWLHCAGYVGVWICWAESVNILAQHGYGMIVSHAIVIEVCFIGLVRACKSGKLVPRWRKEKWMCWIFLWNGCIVHFTQIGWKKWLETGGCKLKIGKKKEWPLSDLNILKSHFPCHKGKPYLFNMPLVYFYTDTLKM